ncbi:S1 RNA-binding domain-containing protein 1-like isoform X2 [Haliotis rufescens]|nr:S1 RNA-binding domain-containing protein 1-like isoform X2 [Haliotis rufescens]
MPPKGKQIEPSWRIEDVIADTVDTSQDVARSLIEMMEEGATIPFIARYRKERTGSMEAEKLREVSSLLDDLKNVMSKMSSVYNSIESAGKMNRTLAAALKRSTSLTEVEHLYAPYKPGHKGSLAERARKLGLEEPALQILDGKHVELEKLVRQGEKGLAKPHDIETGIQHILADIISKDKEAMDEVKRLCETSNVKLESSRSKTSTKKDAEETKSRAPDDSHKFEQYFDFSCPVKYIKSHQVLALNRGEDKKILTVRVTIPDYVKNRLIGSYTHKFVKHWSSPSVKTLMSTSIADAVNRLILPQTCRHIRSELTKTAEKDSILVFASNLKRLLLTPPVRGKTVFGIDPGFKNGCKTAVVSPTGGIQTTQVFYFLEYKSNKAAEKQKLVNIVKTFRCEMIAIGNGVACRQTEQYVAGLIQEKAFGEMQVMYCIVDESGASIYSVSDEAQRELPDLDPTLRGAVSIARRLQDPLAELVKIEPKHIGVGMYQHDIAESKLKTALDSVVEECVSFVGVDINTGSECLLRRIAGLNATKAKKILEWREKNGAFASREQLLGIKGLGQKGYEQCAGFIRVLHDFSMQGERPDEDAAVEAPGPSGKGRKRKAGSTKVSAKKKKSEIDCTPNPLDMTSIHPESYHIATRLMTDTGVDPKNVGQEEFCEEIRRFSKHKGVEELARTYNTGAPTITLITDALSQSLTYDIRDEYDKPLFKKGVIAMEDLKAKQTLTGRVTNVTHFGAFVDVGVGHNGLIHTSQMRQGLEGRQGVQLGDNVNVEVINVDLQKKRLGLKLLGFTKK